MAFLEQREKDRETLSPRLVNPSPNLSAHSFASSRFRVGISISNYDKLDGRTPAGKWGEGKSARMLLAKRINIRSTFNLSICRFLYKLNVWKGDVARFWLNLHLFDIFRDLRALAKIWRFVRSDGDYRSFGIRESLFSWLKNIQKRRFFHDSNIQLDSMC